MLTPDAMVFEGGSFEMWLGHEGGILTNGNTARIKEAQERVPHPFHDIGTQKVPFFELGSGPSSDTESAAALVLDCSASGNVRNNLCCL